MSESREVEILLVEDNPYDAEMTINALEEGQLVNKIHHVKDGEAALAYLFEADGSLKPGMPKVILLDLKLPKIDGLEVLRRLKTHEQAKKIPVVVLTSSNIKSDIDECYALGVNSFVTKPVEFEKFSHVVTSLGCYWMLVNKTA